jgi:hypothetical protein
MKSSEKCCTPSPSTPEVSKATVNRVKSED